jgi:hypothetical protein
VTDPTSFSSTCSALMCTTPMYRIACKMRLIAMNGKDYRILKKKLFKMMEIENRKKKRGAICCQIIPVR